MAGTFRLALILGVVFASGTVAAAKAPQAIVLTGQSAAPVTKVRVGQTVEIRLDAQPGTGFSWGPTRSASTVTALAPLKPSRMLPGGTQIQRFQFKAARKGTYVLGFSYSQPWKGGTKSAKTRTFTIVAR